MLRPRYDSFEQIWKEDKSTLADDLIALQHLEVYAGTRNDVKFERRPRPTTAALDVASAAAVDRGRIPAGRNEAAV